MWLLERSTLVQSIWEAQPPLGVYGVEGGWEAGTSDLACPLLSLQLDPSLVEECHQGRGPVTLQGGEF